MKLAMVGLGRMGMNMARRLLQGEQEVVAYNRSRAKIDEIANEGATPVYSLSEVVKALTPPRIVWLMLPAGSTVDEHIDIFGELLSPGDIVIDGGNTHYKDDIRRQASLAEKGIELLDVGVSGGVWGLKIGYCMMIGGNKDVYSTIKPILEALAPKDGYLYCGPTGAGHFVKMIHNGIEYGMMQAYAEGFAILDKSPYSDMLDYSQLSHLWNQGSVIRSWLLELAEEAFKKDPKLSELKAYVDDSGEGRWSVDQAVETGVAAPIMALSLFTRFSSREENSFSDRVLSALRREFGGHAVVRSDTSE